jgi:GTPase SAR1 family protein
MDSSAFKDVLQKPDNAPTKDYEAKEVKSFDDQFVAKFLANNVSTIGLDLILSIYDFGGQSVFNAIHHLFLLYRGVYLLCFNMEDMVSSDETVVDRFLAEFDLHPHL